MMKVHLCYITKLYIIIFVMMKLMQIYIYKSFEKNNIVPKYILGIEDKSFEEENVTDFMGGVKSIYIEGSKEEALVKIYLTHQMMMKIKT